jgi:hypothetical protein
MNDWGLLFKGQYRQYLVLIATKIKDLIHAQRGYQ